MNCPGASQRHFKCEPGSHCLTISSCSTLHRRRPAGHRRSDRAADRRYTTHSSVAESTCSIVFKESPGEPTRCGRSCRKRLADAAEADTMTAAIERIFCLAKAAGRLFTLLAYVAESRDCLSVARGRCTCKPDCLIIRRLRGGGFSNTDTCEPLCSTEIVLLLPVDR